MSRGLLGLLMVLLVALGGGGVAVLGGDAGPAVPERPARPVAPAGRTDASDGDPASCSRTERVVDIGISATRYPAVRAHWERAIRSGRPRILTIHRAGASERRRTLLRGVPTRPGDDRDEYPPAMARSRADADVAYVDASQNRGAGSVQGIKLRRWCSGQRFRVVWY